MLTLSKSPFGHIRLDGAFRKGRRARCREIVLLSVLALAGCASHAKRADDPSTPDQRTAARSAFDDNAVLALKRGMGSGALGLAEHAADIRDGLEKPPEGWASLDLANAPDLGLGSLSFEEAQRLNGYLAPVSDN